MAFTTTPIKILSEARLAPNLAALPEATVLQYIISGLEELEIYYKPDVKIDWIDFDSTSQSAPLPGDMLKLIKVCVWNACTKRTYSLSYDPNLFRVQNVENRSPCDCHEPAAGESDAYCGCCNGYVGYGSGWAWGGGGWNYAPVMNGFSSYTRNQIQDPQNGRAFFGIGDNNPFGYYNIVNGELVFACVQADLNDTSTTRLAIEYVPFEQVLSYDQPISLAAKPALLSYIRYRYSQDYSANNLTLAGTKDKWNLYEKFGMDKEAYANFRMTQETSIQDIFRALNVPNMAKT